MLEGIQGYINRRYGSKRGLLNYQRDLWANRLGLFREYHAIEWERVERLVYVCAGNICRSPLAERVALDAGYVACSFGLDCTPDRPADPRVIRLAANRGYDLSQHRTTRYDAVELGSSDLVVGMERWHLMAVRERFASNAQTTLIGLWHTDQRPFVPDPYSSGEEYFDRCTQFLLEATLALIARCPNAHREWRTSMPCE
jgi:protein-tyrosine phosphatase